MNEADKDYAPMFMWFGLSFCWAMTAVPVLFVMWPLIGPFGMLFCFGVSFAHLIRGFIIGNRILNS